MTRVRSLASSTINIRYPQLIKPRVHLLERDTSRSDQTVTCNASYTTSSPFTYLRHLSPISVTIHLSPSPFTYLRYLSPISVTIHLSPSPFTYLRYLSPISVTFHLSPSSFTHLCDLSPISVTFPLSPLPFTYFRDLSPISVTFHLSPCPSVDIFEALQWAGIKLRGAEKENPHRNCKHNLLVVTKL